MARRAALMLGEAHGLAGLGCVDNFSQLEGLLEEAGVRDAKAGVDTLRELHGRGCKRVMAALPIAVDAMRLQEAGGQDALAGIFSKIGKSLSKLSLSHQILKKVAPKAAMLSPSQMLLTATGAKKAPKTEAAMLAAAAKKSAKAAKKQAKKDAKAAKKAAKAAAALAAANAQNLSPVEAGAAVLANQSGLSLTTPEAEAFAQQAVQSAGGGGGGMPTESMYDSTEAAGAAEDGLIFGLPPMVAGGIALAGVGVLWLAFGGKRRN